MTSRFLVLFVFSLDFGEHLDLIGGVIKSALAKQVRIFIDLERVIHFQIMILRLYTGKLPPLAPEGQALPVFAGCFFATGTGKLALKVHNRL